MYNRNECLPPLVSVVIPLYMSSGSLRQVLQGLISLNYPKKCLEVIFSYFPSSDETKSIVDEFIQKHQHEYASTFLIISSKRGTSFGRNRGILNSKGKYVLFLDDDVVPPPDILISGIPLLEKHASIAVISYPYLSPIPSIFEEAAYLGVLGRLKRTRTFPMGCSIIRREVFIKVGLFDERLGYPYGSHEDLELAARIDKAGYKILVDGTKIALHIRHLKKEYEKLEKTSFKNSKLTNLIVAVRYYLTKWAETYQFVLKSASLYWKIELIMYVLIPLSALILLGLNFVYGLLYIASVIMGGCIYYKAFNVKCFLLLLIKMSGRVIRSYGYVLYLIRTSITRGLWRVKREIRKRFSSKE
jgi:glycosyltransferase involved in cell wall biosynthesis